MPQKLPPQSNNNQSLHLLLFAAVYTWQQQQTPANGSAPRKAKFCPALNRRLVKSFTFMLYLFQPMYRVNLRLLLVAAPLLLLSCSEEENEDITNTVNRNGAVESSIEVLPLNNDAQVLLTKHKVWVSDSVFKIIEYRDTLPGLGTQIAAAENNEGDQQYVPVSKDYEIFITVK